MADKKLIFSITKKDLRVDYFRAGGKGGQHQNKTSSGVRIVHSESGAVGESREFRSQDQNKKAAFARLVSHPKMKLYIRLRTSREAGVEDLVNDLMNPKNIKTEVKQDGRWVEVEEV